MNSAPISETLKSEITTAMKAGDKERVSALRLVLSELQKDAKEGDGDELAFQSPQYNVSGAAKGARGFVR